MWGWYWADNAPPPHDPVPALSPGPTNTDMAGYEIFDALHSLARDAAALLRLRRLVGPSCVDA